MGVKVNAAYSPYLLHDLNGGSLFEIVSSLHCAIIGLLWQIDDLKNFDESLFESHFDDTTPFHRSQEVHRLLMKYPPRDLIDKALLDAGNLEFREWWNRVKVGESFYQPGGDNASDS